MTHVNTFTSNESLQRQADKVAQQCGAQRGGTAESHIWGNFQTFGMEWLESSHTRLHCPANSPRPQEVSSAERRLLDVTSKKKCKEMSQRAAPGLTMSAVWFLLRTALCRAVMPSFVLKSRCAPPLFSTLMTSAQPSSWAASVRGHSGRFEEPQCQEEGGGGGGKVLITEKYEQIQINKQITNNYQ